MDLLVTKKKKVHLPWHKLIKVVLHIMEKLLFMVVDVLKLEDLEATV